MIAPLKMIMIMIIIILIMIIRIIIIIVNVNHIYKWRQTIICVTYFERHLDVDT